jgi:hypothetical protein
MIIEATTRSELAPLPCLQRPIVLQGVIANVGEERDQTESYGDESPLTDDFIVDTVRQTFPR